MRIPTLFAAILLTLTTSAAHAAYRISVWLPPWLTAAQTRTTQHVGIMTESNPVYYTMNSDGSIKVNWNAETPAWTAAMSGTEVLPTFQNYVGGWNGSVVVNYVIHPSYRDAYTTNITNLVVSKGYAGADIDYEGLPLSARADFNAFIEMLAAKLHAQGKKLSVCVYGKTKDATSYAPAAMQDYAHIGTHADYVKIMTYGDHSTPQPNTTFAWLNNVLTYAKSTIPHAKIQVGLHFYAHDYTSGQSWPDSITYDQVQAILAANPGTVVTRDAGSGEATFTYTSGGVQHTVWFIDGQGHAAKMQYVMQNHGTVGGFAHWSMGEEDPEVWGAIAHLRPSWEFNKDGNHDVVLRNNATGGVALWNIAGNAIVQTTQIAVDPSVVVEVTGRFTRDGHSDVVVRNPSSGAMQLWQMNNHTIAATMAMPAVQDSNWKVVGAGDTDGDGRAEILWYHQTAGNVAQWQLVNGSWVGTMIDYGVPLDWRLQFVGDFNFDGRADLLWRNVTNGQFAMWNLDGATVTSRASISFSASLAWQLAGVADFNRDGYFDWVLRNESTQQVAIYEIKDRTLLNGAACASLVAADWKIVRVGDFTGDNKADILWRHANSATVVLWQMDVRSVVAAPTIAGPGVDWTINSR